MTSITKSQRNGQVKWVEGHSYTINKVNNGSIYWVCQNRCGGRALEKNGQIRVSKGHTESCEPSSIRKEVALVKNKIKERAESTYGEKPCQIVSQSLDNLSLIAAPHLPTITSLKNWINQVRRKNFIGSSNPRNRVRPFSCRNNGTS